MIILVLNSAVMGNHDLALTIVYVTMGLGALLLFSGTLLLYGACLLPVVLVWESSTGVKIIAGLISIAIALAVSYFPGNWAKRQATIAAQSLAKSDIAPDKPILANTLEIRRSQNRYNNVFHLKEPCGLECKALLASGKMQWIRVVMVDGRRKTKKNPNTQTSTFYQRASGDKCKTPGSSNAAKTSCVLMSADNQKKAQLVLEFKLGKAKELKGKLETFSYAWKGWIRSTAKLRKAGKLETIYKKTESILDVVTIPAIIFRPVSPNGSASSMGFAKSKARFNTVSLRQTLSALGYMLPPTPKPEPGISEKIKQQVFNREKPGRKRKMQGWEYGLNDELNRELISVLDLPGSEEFNQQQHEIVFRWVIHARVVKKWTPDLLALIVRVVRDKRIIRPTFIDQIFARNADVAQTLIPHIVEMMDDSNVASNPTPARTAAYRFENADPALLKPYASKILKLIEKKGPARKVLLPSIGRLGINPAPYLFPLDVKDFDNSFQQRIKAACRSQPQWEKYLVPELRVSLELLKSQDKKIRQNIRSFDLVTKMSKALAKLGDFAFVRNKLNSGEFGDQKGLVQSILRDLDSKYPANKLCR